MNKFSIIFFILTVLAANLVAQTDSIDSTLNGIESLYNNGQYLSAELEARRTREQSDLNDSTKVQIEKLIAFSLIAQGKSVAAKERFISLLKIDETFELDPVYTSPKILSVFNDARVRFIAQKKTPRIDTSRVGENQGADRSAISLRAIVFPGWEQIHQGRETAGYVLVGAGTVTLASGIAFELLRANARDEYLNAKNASDISSKYDTYNSYRKAEIYSFAAFAIVYLASEIDVFTHASLTFQPSFSLNNGSQIMLSLRF